MKNNIKARIALLNEIRKKVEKIAEFKQDKDVTLAVFREICKDDRMLQTRKYNEDQKTKELKQAKKLISKISEKFK